MSITVVWDTWLRPGAEAEGCGWRGRSGRTCDGLTVFCHTTFSSISMNLAISSRWHGGEASRTPMRSGNGTRIQKQSDDSPRCWLVRGIAGSCKRMKTGH